MQKHDFFVIKSLVDEFFSYNENVMTNKLENVMKIAIWREISEIFEQKLMKMAAIWTKIDENGCKMALFLRDRRSSRKRKRKWDEGTLAPRKRNASASHKLAQAQAQVKKAACAGFGASLAPCAATLV